MLAKSNYKNNAARIAQEATPQGQLIEKLKDELREANELIEQKVILLKRRGAKYEAHLYTLEEELELAKEQIEILRTRNAGLLSALHDVGRNEPQVRRQEMVKQVEKVVVMKIFPAHPFVETKEGLIKVTAAIKELFDFTTDEEEDGFVTAYMCVVRAKINQLRSYAVKGLKDAVMLGE